MYFSGQEAIYIEGTAHCANMYPEREDDPQQLKQARYTEYEKKLLKIHLSIATGKFKDIKKSI